MKLPHIALLLAIPSCASAQIAFADPVTVSQNGHNGTASSEAANLDGDANIEFISTATNSTSDPHFRVYDFNPETGSFDIIPILTDADVAGRLNRFGGDIATGDINGDGHRDIILPISNNNNGAGSLSWFENPGGVLTDPWTEHVVSEWKASSAADKVRHMSEVAVGDVDGNGKLDIVTRDVSHGIFLLLQKTDGSGWMDRVFIATNPREGLDLFNPDGDNDLDIIINGVWFETPVHPPVESYTQHTYAADWYPSGGSGAEVDDYACQIAVRDFNGDTRDDILITNSEELADAASTDGKPKGIRLYLAPENPKTQPWTEVIIETEHFSWHSAEPTDLNGDGKPDFISAISTVGKDNTEPQLVAFINNGLGTAFEKVVLSDNSPYVYNSSVGDADGDGDDDIFAPQAFNEGPIRYFRNISVGPQSRAEFVNGHLAIVFSRDLSETTVARTVELSFDLSDPWRSGPDHIEENRLGLTGGTEIVRALSKTPVVEQPRQFIRVKTVSEPTLTR